MKKILLSAVLVLMASSAFAVGITGTKHDFSNLAGNSNTYKGASDQICKYCHVPHNAKSANILWSRSLGTGTAPTTFYDSDTMNNVAPMAAPSKAQSTLCLSCHNITPDTDNYLNFGSGGVIPAGTKVIAGAGADDLSNDHPIGFIYNAGLVTADGGGLVAVTPGTQDFVGTSGTKLPLFGATGSGTLECASCHAVHGVGTIPMFLRTTNAGSVLCLKCHIK